MMEGHFAVTKTICDTVTTVQNSWSHRLRLRQTMTGFQVHQVSVLSKRMLLITQFLRLKEIEWPHLK